MVGGDGPQSGVASAANQVGSLFADTAGSVAIRLMQKLESAQDTNHKANNMYRVYEP